MSKRGMDDGMQVGQAGGRVILELEALKALKTVPNGWRVLALRRFAQIRRGTADKAVVQGERLTHLIQYTDVYYKSEQRVEDEYLSISVTDNEWQNSSVRAGDLLVTGSSETVDDIGHSTFVGDGLSNHVFGSDVICVRPHRGSLAPGYGKYIMENGIYLQVFTQLSRGVTRFRFSMDDFKNVPYALPPADVQDAIVSYLDSETARIDALIDRKQRFIDLLLEKRAALITHAVTKGLDPGAEMRDSGHAELGLIPAHWRVMRVRHLFRNLDGRRIPLSAEDRSYRQGSYDYYGASGVIDHIDDYIFDEPLVLIGEDGANLVLRSTPLAFVATGKYWVNNHAHVMRPLDGSPHYWTAALNVIDYTPLIVGSAQPKLTQADLADVPLPVPPPAEITATCEYIERESAAIDRLVTKTRRSIALLREYRTALVSAAVTGQIDIPGTETSEDVA